MNLILWGKAVLEARPPGRYAAGGRQTKRDRSGPFRPRPDNTDLEAICPGRAS